MRLFYLQPSCAVSHLFFKKILGGKLRTVTYNSEIPFGFEEVANLPYKKTLVESAPFYKDVLGIESVISLDFSRRNDYDVYMADICHPVSCVISDFIRDVIDAGKPTIILTDDEDCYGVLDYKECSLKLDISGFAPVKTPDLSRSNRGSYIHLINLDYEAMHDRLTNFSIYKAFELPGIEYGYNYVCVDGEYYYPKILPSFQTQINANRKYVKYFRNTRLRKNDNSKPVLVAFQNSWSYGEVKDMISKPEMSYQEYKIRESSNCKGRYRHVGPIDYFRLLGWPKDLLSFFYEYRLKTFKLGYYQDKYASLDTISEDSFAIEKFISSYYGGIMDDNRNRYSHYMASNKFRKLFFGALQTVQPYLLSQLIYIELCHALKFPLDAAQVHPSWVNYYRARGINIEKDTNLI